MKKKHKKYRVANPSGGFDHVSSSSEFYSSSPVEKPLSDASAPSDSHDVRKTGRHQAVSGREKEIMDPREKMALMAILKSVVLILSLVIALFMLRKGISLYEESIWIDNATAAEKSPMMQEVELVGDFNIEDQNSREQFAKRIELWKEADRLVRSADVLLQRNIYDQAINQCQDALRRDPAHLGALERLGRLYYAKGSYVEAVNAYIRLLSVDPSQAKTQKRLIEALNAFGDYDAVRYMAEWYLDENTSDPDVQRYLARAHYAQEDFAGAAEAYGRLLRDSPKDLPAMQGQATAYMQLEQYEKALVPLEALRENDHRNPLYFKQIAICHAQLEQGQETVQTLLRAGQIFGQNMVLGLIQSPQFDPVREDRVFQAFVDRIGGKEFRTGIEELARKSAEKTEYKPGIEAQLEMPIQKPLDEEAIQLKK